MADPENIDALTRNQRLVFEVLERSSKPLSAYELLEKLQPSGLKAPPQIYRALEKLSQKGMIHRLESLNAFVACSHPDCANSIDSVFAICSSCGGVDEFHGEKVIEILKTAALEDGFFLESSTIELKGNCTKCKEKN